MIGSELMPHLDAHARYIVQRVDEPLKVTTIPDLCGHHVRLEDRSIDVVVGRVAIDEPIHKHGIKWKSPVVRGRIVCVTGSFGDPVVEGIGCRSVRINIIVFLVDIIYQAVNEGRRV